MVISSAARQAQLKTWIQQRRPELEGRKMIDIPTEALGQAARELRVPLAELLAVREGQAFSAGARAVDAGAASSPMRAGLHQRQAGYGGQPLDGSALGARMSAMTEPNAPSQHSAPAGDIPESVREPHSRGASTALSQHEILRRHREARERTPDSAPEQSYDQEAAWRDAELARRQRDAADRQYEYVPPPDYNDYPDYND